MSGTRLAGNCSCALVDLYVAIITTSKRSQETNTSETLGQMSHQEHTTSYAVKKSFWLFVERNLHLICQVSSDDDDDVFVQKNYRGKKNLLVGRVEYFLFSEVSFDRIRRGGTHTIIKRERLEKKSIHTRTV